MATSGAPSSSPQTHIASQKAQGGDQRENRQHAGRQVNARVADVMGFGEVQSQYSHSLATRSFSL